MSTEMILATNALHWLREDRHLVREYLNRPPLWSLSEPVLDAAMGQLDDAVARLVDLGLSGTGSRRVGAVIHRTRAVRHA